MKNTTFGSAMTVFLLILIAVSASLGEFPNICNKCWYEVPNSSLDSAYQNTEPPGWGGRQSIMEAWSGATFDKRRNRLIIAGASGGSNYAGNEVYAFDLDSLRWFRIKDGAGEYDEDDELYAYYRNGGAVPDSQQPRPGMTYDQIAYDSLTDHVYIFGQPFTYNDGTTWPNLLKLNLGTLQWSRVQDLNSSINYGGSLTAQDPATGRIWFFGRGEDSWMADYNPSNDSVVDRGDIWTGDEIPSYQTAAIMPSTNRFLSVGGGQINYWPIVTSGTVATDTLSGTGCDSLKNAEAPGFEWSPLDRKMVGWVRGTHIITMDSTYHCVDVSPGLGNTVSPDAPQTYGTYGRWRYSKKHNVFVLVNRTTGNVYLYRYSADPDSAPNPPVVVITSPSQDTTVSTPTIVVKYTVDGTPDSTTFSLALGNNELIVSRTNAGGTGKDTVYVARGTPGPSDPTWPSGASLTASNIKPSSLTLSWSAANDDSAVAYYQVYVDGVKIVKLPASPRTATVVGLQMNRSYEFRVEALDLRGNISIDGPVRTFSTSSTLPSDPSTVAPQLPKGEANVVAYASAFLYKGSNAVQTGAREEAFDSVRTVVIRGKVENRNGDSLSGVTVSYLGHPEFGSTVTRADGQYDFVVNGGGRIVLQYSAYGYMLAQREAFTRWQEYTIMPTVTLIPVDTAVTNVVLNDTGMHVARASVVTDTNGARQATLLVPPGTTLSLSIPGGATLSPDSMHVRATEYTVGAHGQAAMPASLPGTSAYTYAVEFSIDEAVAAGASQVVFNHPIYSYVENFVGIPTGYPVPVAYLDKEKSAWIPSTDGRVIKIASITSGKANLVVDTTGTTASDAHLDSLGITERERRQLASLYSVNQTLWRVPITHFTPYDYNYPYKLPPDASPPDAPPPATDKPTGKNNTACGSIIDCQNQVLGESVEFPGMPSMNYRSGRVPSRRWNRITIPVTGPTISSSILAIKLEVKIAGRTFQYIYSPAANLKQTFEWDGKDAYGRVLSGKQPYSYTLSYNYPTEYAVPQSVPNPTPSSSLDFGPQSFGFFGDRVFAPTVPARVVYALSNTYTGYMGVEQVEDLGPGWSLENHHTYDPTSGTLHFGNGEDKRVESGLGAVYTVAGGGDVDEPDGLPATKARLGRISEMSVGPDGSLYLADVDYRLIWKVSRDGIIHALADKGYLWFDVKVGSDTTLFLTDNYHIYKYIIPRDSLVVVAGTPGGDPSDGIPATAAGFASVRTFDVGPDGSLYLADRFNWKVRKVTPTGIIQTIAGTGATNFNGDSLPATQTNMGVGSLAVTNDGTLYLSDPFTGRIRRLDPTGQITTVAGDGTVGTLGDGGPALEAQMIADRIEVMNTKLGGTLIYLSDELNNTIRVVDEKGYLYRLAGGGADLATDGIPATSANFEEARGTALDPQGNFYVGTYPGYGPGVVRKIIGQLPDFSNRDIFIPQMDRGEVYQFSPAGRHLKTYSVFTGKVLLTFGYDANGRLTSFTDAFGNTTSISRNGSGDPVSMTNTYSQTLTFDQDGHGNLAAISLPSSETHGFTYDSGSLMESYTTPRGFVHSFTYDSLGRLTEDADPAGGSKTLSEVDSANGGWRTTLATVMGRTKVYDLLPQPDRSTLQKNVDPAGLLTTTTWGGSAVNTTTLPDSTLISIFMGPDPLVHLQSMRSTKIQITTPGGLIRESYSVQGIVLSDSSNPLTLVSFHDSSYVNSKMTIRSYIDSLRMWEYVTPEGRRDTVFVDSLNRIIQHLVPGAEAVDYAYDTHGRLESISQGVGANQRLTQYFYNSEGRLSLIRNPLGDSISFEYDLSGRLTREALPGGQEVRYSFDADGNLDSLAPPGRPAHGFRYNSVGLDTLYSPPSLGAGIFHTTSGYNLDRQLLKVARPDGREIDYVYDSAGRIDSLKLPSGTYTFKYKPITGHLDSIVSPSGMVNAFAYEGGLPILTTWAGPLSGSVGTYYDNDFRIVGNVVSGFSIGYFYDQDGFMTGAGEMAYAWDNHGRRARSEFGVFHDTLEYDTFGQLRRYAAVSGPDTVYEYKLSRDKLGRIQEKIETIGGSTHGYQYAYDNRGRLTSVSVDSLLWTSYSYDGNGNRLTRTRSGVTDSGTYDDQDRLVQYGTKHFTYSNHGDLQRMYSPFDTTKTTYDPLGNLLGVGLPTGDSIAYIPDGLNRRVIRRLNGSFSQGLLYQDQIHPVALVDSAGAILQRYVYGPKRNSPDQIFTLNNFLGTVESAYVVISDHLGSPRLVVNAVSGDVTQRIDYDEFGIVTYNINPSFQPFGFAGGLYDSQSGLVRFGLRDYAPTTGRWTAKDPIGFGGGSNQYIYVENDPINKMDPFGMDAGAGGRDAGYQPPDPSFRDPIDIAQEATDLAEKSGLSGPHNGPQDAYRHCLASCMVTREDSEILADILGEINEKMGDYQHNQQCGEKEMDRSNNKTGRHIGKTAESTAECMARCEDANLQTYTPDTTPGYNDK